MNSSPRSSRTQIVWLLGALVFFAGCSDDLAPPTQGTVHVALQAETAGAAADARIYDGQELVKVVETETSFELRLTAGEHHLRIEKPCSAFSPQSEISLTVQSGHDHAVGWTVSPEGGLAVSSSIPGARILFDGAATGKVTPATLDCVVEGEHTVSVELLGTQGGEPRTVQITGETQTVDFDLTPAPQARGAILELCTATFCPNCPPADAACNELSLDQTLPADRFISVEVHSRWGGTDIFATPSSIARDGFLLGESQGNPLAIVNGTSSRRGAGNGDVPTLVGAYREFVNTYLSQSAAVSLYWLDPAYDAGQTISGSVRLFAISDPPAADLTKLEVWILYYKDQLQWQHPSYGLTTYYHVIREYKELGNFSDLGLTATGSWTDLPYSFDLSGDTQYSENHLGVAVFVQNSETKEVVQIIHRTVTAAP